MKNFAVNPISYDDCKEWCLYKHYAHRIPSISYSFGLFIDSMLSGIITFGVPASPSLVQGAFGGNYKECFLELNRLVVNDGLPKNTLSWFVSSALNKLPKPMVIVSYADTGQNHHGYIYQATNWIYTGLSFPHKEYIIGGLENKHSRHINDTPNGKKSILEVLNMYNNKITITERTRKHRYFYFLGSKRQKNLMRKLLKYSVCKYPKGNNVRYDASYQPTTQLCLF